MTVQSIISQNLFLPPLLPSSPGHRKKEVVFEEITSFLGGQKSLFSHSTLIKSADIGCQRGTQDAAQQGWTRCSVSGICFLSGPFWEWPLLLRAFNIFNTNCLITWRFFQTVGETPVEQSSLKSSFQNVEGL